MRIYLILLFFLLPTYASAARYQHDPYNTRPKDIIREFEAYTVSFDSEDDNNGDSIGDIWGVPEYVAYAGCGRESGRGPQVFRSVAGGARGLSSGVPEGRLKGRDGKIQLS